MFGLGIIEVGIGLALTFLTVSLVCSAVREVIETFSKTRAMDLERGLRELLADADGKGFTASLFSHPIVKGLFEGSYDPSKLAPGRDIAGLGGGAMRMPLAQRRSLPSYIPAGHFSAALLDLVLRGPAGTSSGGAGSGPVLSMENLRAAAAGHPNEAVKRALLSALDLSNGDLATARANVETWFNGTMDRVSGWYKRRTQVILFAIGLGVAVVLNVDAITVANRLGSDAALRSAIVGQAEKVLSDGQPQANVSVARVRAQLESVGLPIGWVDGWPGPQSQPLGPTGRRELTGGAVLQLVIGWLITAIAVMLGAPFWFDVLNKFMVVRSTVKPHEKSPEEPSADR